MVGQQLQWNGVQYGRQDAGVLGQQDDLHALLAAALGVLVGEHEQLATARLDLLQIGLELAQQRVVGRDRDHRHVLVDKRERAVLQLAGRIGLGMNVGNLLELERTLHGDRIMDAAPEKQRVMAFGESLRPCLDLRLDTQDFFQRLGQVSQRHQQLRLFVRGQALAHLGQRHGQEHQRGKLRGKGLGRGDTDLRAGAREEAQVRGADQRRLGHVAHRQAVFVAQRARVLQRRQRVGGLARLRNGDHQRAWVGH